MTADADRLQHLAAMRVFVELSEVERPIWSASYDGVDITIGDVRRVAFNQCGPLARVNKHWNHVWRTFVREYVIDHLCAIVRGAQLRYFIYCLRRSAYTAEQLVKISNDQLIDIGCERARQAINLCPLPNLNNRDTWITERRCIAESLRASVCGNLQHMRIFDGEDTFYASTHLFADTTIVSHTEKTLENYKTGCTRVYDAGFHRTAMPVVSVQQPIDDHVYNSQLYLTAVFPLKTHFDALRDAFPEVLGANAVRNRSLTLTFSTMLRIVRAGLSHSSSMADDLRLPMALHVPELLQCNVGECVTSHSTALRAAMIATHGTRSASRSTMIFILFKLLAHRMIDAQPRSVAVQCDRPGLGCHAASANAIRSIESIGMQVKSLNRMFGIKLSDAGIMSAADVVLHTFDASVYREQRDCLHDEVDEAASPASQRQLHRLVNKMQTALVCNVFWCEFATHHQRLRELWVPTRQKYQLPIDQVFDATHQGLVTLWNYMGHQCNTQNASDLKFIIEDNSEKMLPPLIIEQHRNGLRVRAPREAGGHVTNRRIISDAERVQAALRQQELRQMANDDDGDNERVILEDLWKAEYWIATRNDPYDRQRMVRHSVNEIGRQNVTKLIAGICFNHLGPNPARQGEFVVFWQDGAYDYDRPMYYSVSDKHHISIRAQHYYHALAQDSASAKCMASVRSMFQPLVIRLTRMFNELAALPSREQRNAIVASMCNMRGQCGRCEAVITSKRALARGTCERCCRKRKQEADDNEQDKKARTK